MQELADNKYTHMITIGKMLSIKKAISFVCFAFTVTVLAVVLGVFKHKNHTKFTYIIEWFSICFCYFANLFAFTLVAHIND